MCWLITRVIRYLPGSGKSASALIKSFRGCTVGFEDTLLEMLGSIFFYLHRVHFEKGLSMGTNCLKCWVRFFFFLYRVQLEKGWSIPHETQTSVWRTLPFYYVSNRPPPLQSSAWRTPVYTATRNAAREVEQNRGLDPREAGQAVPRALVQPSGPVPDEDRVDHPRGRSAVQRTGENCAVFGFEVRAVSIIGGVCFRYRSTGNFCLWCVLLLSKYGLFLFVVYMYDTHVLWFSKYAWFLLVMS